MQCDLIERVDHEGRRVCIGLGDRADATQPQFLDEPVLQRQVGALDTTLGLARVRTERLDIELVQGAAELCDSLASRARPILDVEDAELVAIECDGLAVCRQILRKGLKIAEGRFGAVKCNAISRPVASSMNTSSVQAGARSSNQR